MAQENILINFEVDYSQLTTAQEQLAKTGKIDDKGFQAIQSAINTTADDTKGLIKTFKDVAGASIKMGKTVEDAFGAGIQDALDEAGVSMKEFEGALKKANQPAISLKKELLQLKEAMARMKAEGKDTGKEFDALRARAGKLADAIADTNKEIKNAGSDTRGIDNVVGSISALAGGYAAVQGAAALFGEENEDVQKALLKVNGAMALAQGLQVVYNASLKEGALAKLADSVSTGAQTAAQKIYAVAVGTSTGAMRAFRIALLATGIGALVAVLVLAADAMGLFGSNAEDAKLSVDDINKSIETQNRLLQENITNLEQQGKVQAERLKQQGRDAVAVGLNDIKIKEAQLKILEEAELQAAKDRNRNALQIALIDRELAGKIGRLKESELKDEKTRLLEIDKSFGDNSLKLTQDVETKRREIQLARLQTIGTADELQRKADEKFAKARLDAIEKARIKELASIKEIVTANLKKDADAEEQLRIHYDNLSDITEEERAKIEAINKKWDDLRLEMQQSFIKSSEDAAKKAQDEEDKLQAKRIKNAQDLIGVASKVADFYSQLSALASEQERERINGLKRQLEALEEAGAITEKQAKIRRQQIEIEERKAKQKEAEREKRGAIFGAIINTALAITNAIATGDPYTAAIRAAIAAALGAAQIALISSKPIPKFFKGKKGNYEGPGVVADMGSELVERDGRMFLYTKPTQTYLGAKDKVYTAGETRQILHNTNISTQVKQQPAATFDYEKFGASIPKDRITIDFNKDYVSEAIEQGLSRHNRFVTRYQFKK